MRHRVGMMIRDFPENEIRTIATIAREIRADWANVNYAAEPYLRAMDVLGGIEDNYGWDTAREIVLRFLGNARAWRGPVAKRIKAELNAMLKGAK